MKKYRKLSGAFLLVMSSVVTCAQKFNPAELETTLHKAIEKAYPASVRIWGFDPVRQVQMSAQFSGVVVSPDGLIYTAAHVNQPGKTFKVMFPDGRSCIATGLGEIELNDNRSVPDVAVMKIIEKGPWPYAETGWSSSLRKDEPCISIAYPESQNQPLPMIRFGYIAEVRNKYGFIRSTCLMEPGDSGGPLFDYFGRVIGLHSAIDVSEKDNFEIPVDLYRKYRTALDSGITYQQYPENTDPVGTDPLDAKIRSIRALEKPEFIFTKAAADLEGCVLLVESRKDDSVQRGQATLFSSEELSLESSLQNGSILVSKSSLVGESPFVLVNGKRIAAAVLKRNRESDLVLLMVPVKLKGGIRSEQFNADSLRFGQVGRFLLSPLSGSKIRVSVVGSREFSLPKITSAAFLGAEIGYKLGWVMLSSVTPGSPADVAGLHSGDQILSLDGLDVNEPGDFVQRFQKYWPGDKAEIKIMRSDSTGAKDVTLEKEVTLGKLPDRHFNHPAELFAGGKSVRRDGFARVFVHDAVLQPNECGGPVFDCEGRFYGINIARYSRTTSIVVPAAVVLNVLKDGKSR